MGLTIYEELEEFVRVHEENVRAYEKIAGTWLDEDLREYWGIISKQYDDLTAAKVSLDIIKSIVVPSKPSSSNGVSIRVGENNFLGGATKLLRELENPFREGIVSDSDMALSKSVAIEIKAKYESLENRGRNFSPLVSFLHSLVPEQNLELSKDAVLAQPFYFGPRVWGGRTEPYGAGIVTSKFPVIAESQVNVFPVENGKSAIINKTDMKKTLSRMAKGIRTLEEFLKDSIDDLWDFTEGTDRKFTDLHPKFKEKIYKVPSAAENGLELFYEEAQPTINFFERYC